MTSSARDKAEELDADDVLAHYHGEFVGTSEALVYLDGNSLGRIPIATRDRVRHVLDHEWADRLIRSWDDAWIELPTKIGDLIGVGLLGADPGEVVVGENTTVALYKAVSAALDARPGRTAVVVEQANFPTDRYVIESLARQRGLTVRWIAESGTDGVNIAGVGGVLDDDVAVVVLSHVDYRSAALADVACITAAVHEVGAVMAWDLCHSVGVVPIDVTGDEVDLAVGCTYKYLNGGPGAPAFTYVRSELQDQLRQPIWGWWGRRNMFEMGAGYEPEAGIRSWLTGTPSVLSMAAIEPSVAMVIDAGIGAIRAKSVALTEYAIELFDEYLAPNGFGLQSPRDSARRGGHVTVGHPDAEAQCRQLIAGGVIPDFRRPDGIRCGLAPLTTRFTDVHDGLSALAALT